MVYRVFFLSLFVLQIARGDSLEDVLTRFSYRSNTISKDLVRVSSRPLESASLIVKLTRMKQGNQSALVILFGNLIKKVEVSDDFLYEIALDSANVEKIRRLAAKEVDLSELKQKGAAPLLTAFFKDLNNDKLTLFDLLIAYSNKANLQDRKLIENLEKVYKLLEYSPQVSLYGGICTKIDKSATIERQIKLLLTFDNSKSLAAFCQIYESLDEDQKKKTTDAFTTMLRLRVEHGNFIGVQKVAKGRFRKTIVRALISNLDNNDPHRRLDAILALRGVTGKSFRYNPADDKMKRQAAIDRWKEFAPSAIELFKRELKMQGAPQK